MKIRGKEVEATITLKVEETGQTYTFKVPKKDTLILLHPETEEELLEVDFSNPRDPQTKILKELAKTKSPTDVGKCIIECARDCAESGRDGILCSAGCVLMCSTIII